MAYERSNIRSMAGYTPGEQPDSPEVIKLNTNENPFPPGPGVARALAAIAVASLRRYPPPTAAQLRRTIAALHGVEQENVIVTNGGDELLRLAVSTFVEEEEAIAFAAPSYSLYEVLADAHGCGTLRFPLDEDWSLPAGFAARLNDAGAKLCFVVNPHAPSGRLTSAAELQALARDFHGVLVLDEAYVDFVDPALGHDCVPLVRQFDNVLILRTFSKGYSLAGLRMAYGLASPSLIDPMQFKTKDSYNTDLIAQTLAQASLENREEASGTWAYVREQRARVAGELAALGLASPPSQSNFLLVTVPPPHRAQALYEGLKRKGILVRWFAQPRLDDKLRITIGTQEQNTRLLTALKELLACQA